MMKKVSLLILAAIITGLFQVVNAQESDESLDSYLDMSLEELMNIEVTSVSKKSERLQDVPSSIYVITSEDIGRSSALDLMQLLRESVPGYWAVNNDFNNVDALIRNSNEGSVLVLLDGTPMQDLMFSTFDYENFNIPLEFIDRIEVIKGSGGTIYGANSATGVISIYSKKPTETAALFANANYSAPGRAQLSLIGTPIKSEKVQASFYGKYSYFKGFEQMPETVNPTSVVPKSIGEGDTTIINRYTGDDNKINAVAVGYNFSYQPSVKLKITSSLHFSLSQKDNYAQYFLPEKSGFIYTGATDPSLYSGDTVVLKEVTKSRLIANLQADYSFSELHTLFGRVSTNMENSDFTSGGTYTANNYILDFELQDNISLPYNFISFGGNIRSVNYKLSDFGENNQSYFTKNENQAMLIGIFAQDKVSMFEEKLNLYLGVKAENFSLINDKFYFSPMAKFTVNPISDITLWGGFSQSYTTPGYIQTNVEFYLFRAESPKVFYDYAYPQVSYVVYQGAYQQALAGGADDATAAAMAQAYVESDEGMVVIDDQTNAAIAGEAAAFPGHYNVAAINGPSTVPTSFHNYELGVRLNMIKNLAFETNFYYSVMKDGIGNSLSAVGVTPSVINPGENLYTYYYGNYFKGTNMGIESILKYMPTEKLMLELSHSWYSYTLELQENDEFDISTLPEDQRNLKDDDYPQMPEHVLRAKVYYDLLTDLKFTIGATYATAHYMKFGTIESTYQYDRQRFDPLFGDLGNKTLVGGKMDDRFILNFRIDKYFLNNKLGVYIFGNDVLSSAFTEGINQLVTVYPRQTSGIFGLGLNYTIN